MRFVVLLKPVPDVADLRSDPATATVIREGRRLFPNPFDQRALRLALDSRRPGEPVTVIAMGPPGAVPAVKEALALGADRAVLIADPRIAGSDTLATARVLAAAIGPTEDSLVLAGDRSTDSETGQLGAEIAALLDLPVASGVQRFSREPSDDAVEVVTDVEGGWRRFRVRPPALVTVGEKAAKLRKVTEEEVARLPDERVERWDLDRLGIDPGRVGSEGSPTVVERLRETAPERTPVVFSEGTVHDRCANAVGVLRERVERRTRDVSGARSPGPASDASELAVLVTGGDGGLDLSALEIVAETHRSVGSLRPGAIWAGEEPSPSESRSIIGAGGLRGHRIALPRSATSSSRVARSIAALLTVHPEIRAFASPSTSFGREVAGQLAARCGLGLVGDATSVRSGDDGRLVWGKPAFGGSVIADVVCRTLPALATVRPGTFAPALALPPTAHPTLEWDLHPGDAGGSVPELLETGADPPDGWGDLDRARVVVCVGMGVGAPEKLEILRPAVARWGAALAGTRRAVDAGWLARSRQVGLTGRHLAPVLAILLGVQGSTNHLIGWRRASSVLSVNRDPAAPVFRSVDVGILGAWEETWPSLSDALDPLVERINARPS